MPTSPYRSEVRLLLRSALVLFTFTVVVGILNGTDLVEFDRKALLTHVHAGTLGWITMSVIAATFWMFALGDSRPAGRSFVSTLALAAIVSITAYALTFLTTIGVVRPAVGAIVLVVIVAVLVWVARQLPGRTLSVPHVAVLAAVTMSIFGALLGVLLGYRLAAGSTVIPATAAEAHPAAMVIGFLVPVGMAFIEWVLDPTSLGRRASALGWVQIALPFLGGVLAMVGLLASITPLVTLGLPFEVIGLVILIVRLRRPLMAGANLAADGMARYGSVALVFLIVNIALLVYLVVNFFSQNLPPPINVLLALDHSIFIGVMTNCILAVIAMFRRPVSAMLGHLLFFGLNLGLVGFLAGLLLESATLKQISTPAMGIAILLAVAVNVMSLGEADEARA